MNSFQLIITYLKFSILFVFEYPFYIDCLFTIYAVALHLFERTCKLCKKDVEDEIHFVCVCPALELIRMKYFKILNIDKSELLCPPPWGVDILFLLFSPSDVRCPMSDVRCPASGVRCPASRMVSAHLKEKY